MKANPVQITCVFSEAGDVKQILTHSFLIYLDRILADSSNITYNGSDEWSLISGGRLCT